MVYNLTPWWHPPTPAQSTSNNYQQSMGVNYGGGSSTQVGTSQGSSQGTSSGASQGTSWNQSSTYIPEYSQTPILEGIAKYAAQQAPQVYQWGMDQYNRNQGNIDAMMRNAMSYASPQRQAQEMGMAEAGVQRGAEAGRQNAIRDLESYGIDPSSGRYAALDQANRVSSGAMAAGAGNQQRMATEAAGNAMQNQAMSMDMQNVQMGYGASNAMNQLLGTGMQLQYSPLGSTSSGGAQNTSSNTSQNTAQNTASNTGTSNNYSTGYNTSFGGGSTQSVGADNYAEGGDVPAELSKSNGGKVDDVPANLTAGEFIIPKDIVDWKGQEFFYKLMAQTRKMRAMGGDAGGGQQQLGYGAA